MKITDVQLEKFRSWLMDRGRTEGTAKLYVLNVRRCADHKRGLVARLTSGELAAKTLRTNKAALCAWAKFSKDKELEERLEDIKLPPADRAKVKHPIDDVDDWKKLVNVIRARPDSPVKAVLLIMARRGLRCGDVLRLRKGDIQRALSTGTLSYEAKGRRRHEWPIQSFKGALEMLGRGEDRWHKVEDLMVTDACTSEGLQRRSAAAKAVAAELDRCARKASILNVSPHRLRRTYAVHFLRRLSGDPNALLKLQKHMGWANIQTAAGYVDAFDRKELDAIGDEMIRELDED